MSAMQILCDAGITYRQVDSWCRNGYLRPRNNDCGQGSLREWPDDEIKIALTMKQLIDVGIRAGEAAKHARKVVKTRRALGVDDAPISLDLGNGVVLTLEPVEYGEDVAA
jgi:hypothetical protein